MKNVYSKTLIRFNIVIFGKTEMVMFLDYRMFHIRMHKKVKTLFFMSPMDFVSSRPLVGESP